MEHLVLILIRTKLGNLRNADFCKLVSKNHCLSFMHDNCWRVVKFNKYLLLWKIILNYLGSLILFSVQKFGVYLSFFALLAVPCFKTQRFLFFVMFTLVLQNEKYLTLFAFTRGWLFLSGWIIFVSVTLCKRECTDGCLKTYKARDIRGKTAIVASSVDHTAELYRRVK